MGESHKKKKEKKRRRGVKPKTQKTYGMDLKKENRGNEYLFLWWLEIYKEVMFHYLKNLHNF